VVIGEGGAAEAVAAAVAAQGKAILAARLKADDATVKSLRGKRVLAFAGIGDPDRFFRTLRASGVEVASERVFADHHPFTRGEIEAMVAEAKQNALTLVTTEKDLARLASRGQMPGWAQGIVPFPVKLEFDGAVTLSRFVSDRLHLARDRTFRKKN